MKDRIVLAVITFALILHTTAKGQQQVFQAQPGAVPQSQYQQPVSVQTQQEYSQAGQETTSLNDSGMNSSSGDIQAKQDSAGGNPFLEYYSKQGSNFSGQVFYQTGTGLSKRQISSQELNKAVIVFFGDWCPHCERFLSTFSKHADILKSAGVTIMFIHIPSIETLKNWKDPNIDEFNAAKNKVSSHGIKLSESAKVVWLGDRVTLAKAGIEGLPVVIAVKNGKEYFRGVGNSGVSKMDFSDQAVLKQFLAIWDESPQKNKDTAKEDGKSDKKSAKHKGISKNSKGKKSKSKHRRVNRAEARRFTDILNSI